MERRKKISKLEIIMWCIAYALGKDPRISEIKRAKCEVLSVEQRSVNKVVKSAKLLLPSMSEQEMSFCPGRGNCSFWCSSGDSNPVCRLTAAYAAAD
jgi:hypothetical protein